MLFRLRACWTAIAEDDRLFCGLEDVAELVGELLRRPFGEAGAGLDDFQIMLAKASVESGVVLAHCCGLRDIW